jgi:hypothetical protein
MTCGSCRDAVRLSATKPFDWELSATPGKREAPAEQGLHAGTGEGQRRFRVGWARIGPEAVWTWETRDPIAQLQRRLSAASAFAVT